MPFAASGHQWPIDICDAELNQRLFPPAVPVPTDSLILDDWGLVPFTAAQRRDSPASGLLLCLPILGRIVDAASFPLADGQHQDDNPSFFNAVNESVAGAAQFDLVAILHAVKRISRHSWPGLPFLELSQKLEADGAVELAQFFQRFWIPLDCVLNGHWRYLPRPRR